MSSRSKSLQSLSVLSLCSALSLMPLTASTAQSQTPRPPNILVIMGDDIGMWNIGAYIRGMMAGRTPNLDKLAKKA